MTGCVITPGLVNTHHHLLQTSFRRLPGTRGGTDGGLAARYGAAYSATGVGAELCWVAAGAGLAEALLCGVTTVDHHSRGPLGRVEIEDGSRVRAGAGGGVVAGDAGDGRDPDLGQRRDLALERDAVVVPAVQADHARVLAARTSPPRRTGGNSTRFRGESPASTACTCPRRTAAVSTTERLPLDDGSVHERAPALADLAAAVGVHPLQGPCTICLG